MKFTQIDVFPTRQGHTASQGAAQKRGSQHSWRDDDKKNAHVGTKKMGEKTRTRELFTRLLSIDICVYVCVYIKYMYIWKTHKMVGFFVQMLTLG